MTDGLVRPRNLAELTTFMAQQMAPMGVPRSDVSYMLQSLSEQGFLSFDETLDVTDFTRIVRAVERAGFRIRKGANIG
jgi:hypothetical protein